MGVLYHLGVMQKLVAGMAWVMRHTMGISGSEALSAAGNVFVGMTEAPLLIRPYVAGLTDSELLAVMTGGLATIAGSVLAAYVSFGVDAGHLLCASVMSAPAALVVAKIMIPETEESQTAGAVKVAFERTTRNVIDAAASGASEGLRLALNVGAMLIAFLALIAMVNFALGQAHSLAAKWLAFPYIPDSLQEIFGVLLRPLAWTMGVPWRDAGTVGSLMGIKIAANEWIAYDTLVKSGLDGRSLTIATYALCGFANFGSIGILIGGIGGIAPERRHDLARLSLRALAGGAIASFLTASIAGMLL
jgi:CNT family concentrative nucleoside transporter